MPATPFYAAIFALLLVALSIRTLRLRHKLRVGIGDGGEPRLQRAIRVHANFCEYVPLAVLLIYFFEVFVGQGLWVHVLAVTLLVGRLLHAYGVSQTGENYRYRVTGMALTFTVILTAAGSILAAYLV